MTARLIHLAATLAVAVALADAARGATTADGGLDRVAGVKVGRGQGQIGERTFPITVATGAPDAEALATALQTELAGRATVATVPSPFGAIVLELDMASPHCPKCLPARPEFEAKTRASSYSILVLELPGAGRVAIGTPTNAVAGTQPASRYTGTLLKMVGPTLHDVATMSFRFGATTVASTTAMASGNARTVRTALLRDLAESGFQPVPGTHTEAAEGQGAFTAGPPPLTLLAKGDTVVAVGTRAGAPGTTLIQLNETTSTKN